MNRLSLGIDGLLRSSRRPLAEVAALPRWSRILVVVLLLAAWALVFPRGGPAAVVIAVLCAAMVTIIAWIVADPSDRRWVLLCALLAILAREALVGAVDVALLTRNLRWYAPDESVYISRAYAIWQHWLQPAAPFDNTDPYMTSWYVHGIARTYLLFGENLVVVKLMNTLLGVTAGLLGYRAMRNLGMPGARWALVLLLFFPSVAFWSALTLKDAYVVFFLMTSLWAASEFVRGRNPVWLAVALLAVVPLETVRLYILVTGALALLAVPFALTRWRERLVTAGALIVGVYVLFAIVQPLRDLGPNVFYIPILVRSSAAEGAKSSFVEPRPVIQGQPGQQFQIAVTSGSTPPPCVTPRVIEVQPGTVLVVEQTCPPGSARPTPSSPGPSAVVVHPGDIVMIVAASASGATPAPAAGPTGTPSPSPQIVVIDPEAKNTVGLSTEVDPDQSSFSGSLATNARHLPIGLLYTLLAPFPWTARTLEQLATVPEMLIWYVCIAAALAGFVTLWRQRDLRYAHGVAAIIGLAIVLSLIGANVGTLVRSRAMLIPYVLLLSGVGIDWLLRRYPRLGGRWRGRLMGEGRATSDQSPS